MKKLLVIVSVCMGNILYAQKENLYSRDWLRTNPVTIREAGISPNCFLCLKKEKNTSTALWSFIHG